MGKKITINENKYEIIKDYNEGFDLNSVTERITDYYNKYDYILGDWAYGKLRLKGFCNKDNKNYNEINSYENIEEYIQNYCAYKCKYFIIKILN